MKKLILSSLLLALLAGCSGKYVKPEVKSQQNTPLAGTVTLNGKAFKRDLDNKTVVLEFFASWCHACQDEMPKLSKVYNSDFKNNKNVEFIGISTDFDPSETKDFLVKNKVNFPVAWDQNQDLQVRFDIEELPATVVLDKNGKIVLRTQGEKQKSPEELRAFISNMSAAKAATNTVTAKR